MPNVDLERTRWPWAFCYSDLAPKSLKRLTCSVEINEEQLHLHIKVCLYMIIRKEIPVFKAKHIIYLKTYRLEGGGGCCEISRNSKFSNFCLLPIRVRSHLCHSSSKIVCLVRSEQWHWCPRMSVELYGFGESKSISTAQFAFRNTG